MPFAFCEMQQSKKQKAYTNRGIMQLVSNKLLSFQSFTEQNKAQFWLKKT